MHTFEEAEIMLEELISELPPGIFNGLNCGVSLLPDTLYNSNGLLILGQYHVQPYGLGRYVTINYGSLLMVHGHLPAEAFKAKIKETLHHELTHHLEHMAGDKTLEIKDEQDVARLLAGQQQRINTKKSIKMVAIDLGGTLLRSDYTISDYTASILKKCRKKGIKVVYVTTRHNISKFPKVAELADGLVSNNGATAYIGDTLIYEKTIPAESVRQFLFAVHNVGVKILFKSDDEYVDFNTLDDAKALLAMVDTTDEPKLAEFVIKKFLPPNSYLLVKEGGRLIVILHNEARKCNGVAALAEHWGINSSEIVAFGDDTIDIDMLKYCGTGVAVGNALDEVKNIANYTCESNDDDGVAKWLDSRI